MVSPPPCGAAIDPRWVSNNHCCSGSPAAHAAKTTRVAAPGGVGGGVGGDVGAPNAVAFHLTSSLAVASGSTRERHNDEFDRSTMAPATPFDAFGISQRAPAFAAGSPQPTITSCWPSAALVSHRDAGTSVLASRTCCTVKLSNSTAEYDEAMETKPLPVAIVGGNANSCAGAPSMLYRKVRFIAVS